MANSFCLSCLNQSLVPTIQVKHTARWEAYEGSERIP